ncbi:thioredoxin domain-containing protein [Devosia sp.]|uniref:thioredoxin domain-containing protein n=1 Tax=Devosia sp. TaxID=1871048 RepID=UPI0032667450
MKFNRRETLILAAAASALSFAGIGAASAADGDKIDEAKLMAPKGVPDHALGKDTATVTVIEYASPTCPHCAAFSNDVLPTFLTTYVDSGLVKYILRPFSRNVLDSAIFMLAEAAGPTAYHNVISTYFKTQGTWGVSDKPRDAIFDVAKQLGFTQETFDAALTNQDLFTGIEALRDQAIKDFGLAGTPTFYINGKTLSGEQSLAQLAAEIDPLLPAGTAPAAPAAVDGAMSAPSTEPAVTPVAPAETSTPVVPAK